MAHFDLTSATSVHRTSTYGSFAVLGLRPNCTHVQNLQTNSMKETMTV